MLVSFAQKLFLMNWTNFEFNELYLIGIFSPIMRGFLQPSKNMHVRLIDNSKLSL